MRKFIISCSLLLLPLLFTACGKSLDEGWNGLYKAGNDSNYYILLYTDDNEELSLRVVDKGKDFVSYPIQYDSIKIDSDNSASYSSDLFGDIITFNIVKDNNKITVISSSTDTTSLFNNINGVYTKYKNVSSDDVSKEF